MRAWLIATVLCAGCGADFDPASYLAPDQLRVLGVVADPPQAAPGQTSQLTLIMPDFPDVTYEWSLCTQPPPPGSAAVDALCLEGDLGVDSFLVPVDSSTNTAEVTMPATASPSTLGIPDSSGGFYQPVRIRLRAGSQQLDVVYGLRLAIPQLPANHNPVIDSTTYVAEPLDASPMDVTELSTDPANPTPIPATEPTFRNTLTDDSYEVFPQLTGAPPNTMITMATEQPRFFWFADAGQFSEDTTGRDQPDTKLKLDDPQHHPASSGQPINLWVVVRDDRGGTTFTHRYLVVQ